MQCEVNTNSTLKTGKCVSFILNWRQKNLWLNLRAKGLCTVNIVKPLENVVVDVIIDYYYYYYYKLNYYQFYYYWMWAMSLAYVLTNNKKIPQLSIVNIKTKKCKFWDERKLWPWSCKTKIVKCKITVKDFEYTINQILHISQIPVLNFDKVFKRKSK